MTLWKKNHSGQKGTGSALRWHRKRDSSHYVHTLEISTKFSKRFKGPGRMRGRRRGQAWRAVVVRNGAHPLRRGAAWGRGVCPPGMPSCQHTQNPHPSFSPGTRAATAPTQRELLLILHPRISEITEKRAEVLYKIDPTLHPGPSLGRLGYAGLGWRALPHFYIEPHRCARAFPCGLWLCGICEACSLLDAQHFLSGPLQKRSAEPGPAWGQRGASGRPGTWGLACRHSNERSCRTLFLRSEAGTQPPGGEGGREVSGATVGSPWGLGNQTQAPRSPQMSFAQPQ